MVVKKEITSKLTFEYLKNQLRSEKVLSKNLCLQDIESGKVYTYVPENTSENQLYNFEVGSLYPSEKKLINGAWLSKVINEAKPRVKDFIYDYLNENPLHCCIFEECNSVPSDPWVINSKREYTSINEEMYYFFDKENLEDAKLENAFLFSGGWYFLCVLSTLDINTHSEFEAYNKIPLALMENISNNSTTIIVGAYDGEGYLIWERI